MAREQRPPCLEAVSSRTMHWPVDRETTGAGMLSCAGEGATCGAASAAGGCSLELCCARMSCSVVGRTAAVR